MRLFCLLSLALLVTGSPRPLQAEGLPAQLEMRVLSEPTAFPSTGKMHLVYELFLTNFGSSPLKAGRLEVLDAASGASLASFAGAALNTLFQPLGESAKGEAGGVTLAPGGSAVLFLFVALEPGKVPARLRHRLTLAEGSLEGAATGTHGNALRVLSPPLRGGNWLADDGPSNTSHHRLGILVYEGHPSISRRLAIDWMRSIAGATFKEDEGDNRAYYDYGAEVFAVCDATVVEALDGIPENVPNHRGERAVPMSPATLSGNHIVLDLGDGEYARYLHLKTGSVSVRAGDKVHRGQMMARLGNSGDSNAPHLHFQVDTAANLLAGEGVPYVIDEYRLESGGAWQTRREEMPLDKMIVDFGEVRRP